MFPQITRKTCPKKVYLRGIFKDTIVMRKTTLILAFLAVVACGGAQTGSAFHCDTTGISIFNAPVDGKFMPATLVYCSEDKHYLTYELRQPFMENDTQYIYRSYQFYKCDTCSAYDTCVSSYYIIPKQDKNHIAKVLKMYYVKEPDFKEDSYLSDAYHEWRSHNPKMKIERRDLDDMPRHWFRIEKYQGQYALSIDYNYGMAFTDSMIVFYYMETWFSQYGEVKKLNSDVYYYEDYDYSPDIKGWAKTKNWLHPSVLVKGLYILSSLSADGILDHTLVTPQENLKYFDLINAYMCDLQFLDYDTVNYEEHTDPALMADIRNLQKSIKKQASKGREKTDNKENPTEPIVVEGVEMFPADGSLPTKSFSDTVSGEPPVMFAEEMPEFPGGPDSLNAFLRQNLKWPIGYGCWSGTVLVEFIVEIEGSITNPRVEVSLYKDFDEEAIRVVKLMPKWKPARTQGEPVRCYYKIPVTFSM